MEGCVCPIRLSCRSLHNEMNKDLSAMQEPTRLVWESHREMVPKCIRASARPKGGSSYSPNRWVDPVASAAFLFTAGLDEG